jgi:hypothetical protein
MIHFSVKNKIESFDKLYETKLTKKINPTAEKNELFGILQCKSFYI